MGQVCWRVGTGLRRNVEPGEQTRTRGAEAIRHQSTEQSVEVQTPVGAGAWAQGQALRSLQYHLTPWIPWCNENPPPI